MPFAKESRIARVVAEYFNGVILIGLSIQLSAHACKFAIKGCHTQHRIILIIVGTLDHTLMIKCDPIRTQINTWT